MNTVTLAASFEAQTTSPVPGLIGGLIGYVLVGIFLGKVFAKAGEESWKAWVPFLNIYTEVKLAGYNGWTFLFYLVPILGFVWRILVGLRLGKAFGKDGVFSFFLLAWLSVIGYIIVGTDDSRYDRSRIPA